MNRKFSQEVRERAVRMVAEHRSEHSSDWETIRSIAEKIGCSAETLRKWVRQYEIDSGRRDGQAVARGIVGRPMREMGIGGMVRGRKDDDARRAA